MLPSTCWAVLTCLLLLAVPSAAFESDFNFYPSDAQPCLYSASDEAGCTSETVAQLNSCLCRNGGNFITNAASCLGKSDRKDIDEVYTTMEEACSDSKTPIGLTKNEFKDAADADSPTTTAPTSTPTRGPTNSPDEQDDKGDAGGLSTGATIGIAVGCAVAGAALVTLAACLLFRRYRKRSAESHPMLAHDLNSAGYYYEGGSEAAFPSSKSNAPPSSISPDLGTPFSGWASPPMGSYGQGHVYQQVVQSAELPVDTARVEMEGSTTPPHSPAELPGSEPSTNR